MAGSLLGLALATPMIGPPPKTCPLELPVAAGVPGFWEEVCEGSDPEVGFVPG
jgi:hypothetical protein